MSKRTSYAAVAADGGKAKGDVDVTGESTNETCRCHRNGSFGKGMC
jgi:hypothetical protein